MNQSQEQNNVDGFESEIQDDELELDMPGQYMEIENKTEDADNTLVPPGRSITNKKYSLYPDMVTGWNGLQKISHPIPITTQAPYFDRLFNTIMQHKNCGLNICYLGPRYDNSFFAWFKMPFQFPYSHLQPPINMKFTNRVFIGQNPQHLDQIIFDSFFENSNLDCAIKVGEKQYDLYLRVDSNTRGHFQWFNFTVKNLQPNTAYKLNICNLQKDFTLYSRGMKPYILSSKEKEKAGKDWQQKGDNIKYERKAGKSLGYFDPKCKNFHQLSFEISTKYQDDILQIAYCIPYTYSDLIYFLKQMKKKNSQKRFYSQTKLCKSLGGIPIPLITITEELNEDVELKQKKIKKKCIVVVARVHPGESNSSFLAQGFINFLCSNNKYARHLRSNILFKIVPMINPDGVSFGNHRTGLSGKDFNREYLKPDPSIFPQIYNFKKLVLDYKKKFGKHFLMFLDFHGHTSKKNIFMYGPQYSLADRLYYQARILPKILSKQTKMFRYYSCTFKIENQKKTTARAVFMQLHNIQLSYTIQISNFCYYDTQQLANVLFTSKQWLEMGKQLGYSISDYLSILHRSQILRIEKYKKRQLEKANINEKKNIISRFKEKKRQKKKSPQVRLGYGRIIYKEQQEQNDEDFMNYIYQQIQNVQLERQKNNQKNQMEEGFNEQNCESDCQSAKNDLQEQKIKQLYRFIKRKQSGEIYETQAEKILVNSKNQIKLKASQNISVHSHRRVQSVSINRRNSQRGKSFHMRSPQKINIGQDINKNQQNLISLLNGRPMLGYITKQIKQKPKTFEQFLAGKNAQKKTKIKKQISGKKIHLIDPSLKDFDMLELQSQPIEKSEISPTNSSLKRAQIQRRLKNFEQKKLQIYQNIQLKKKEQKNFFDTKKLRNFQTFSPSKFNL